MYRNLLTTITITVVFMLGAVFVFAFSGPSVSYPDGAPASWNMSGSNTFYTLGNIGVGSTTPSYAVTVSGGDIETDQYARGATQVCIGSDCRTSWGDAPTSAVAFFNLASCPSGWTEYTTGRGRYLVGLPSGGTLGATVGTALSNLENRPVGQHTHGVTDPGHDHGTDAAMATTIGGSLGNTLSHAFIPTDLTDTSYTGITLNNSGDVSGTNAPYLQLLVCQKD